MSTLCSDATRLGAGARMEASKPSVRLSDARLSNEPSANMYIALRVGADLSGLRGPDSVRGFVLGP